MIDLERAEALAFSEAVAMVARRDLLIVTGTDAASYLHGQLSQDVEGLDVGASAPTLLLQPQGKIDSWLRLHRRGDAEFWLDAEAGHGPGARERLERFKLRVDVTIEVVTTEVLAVRGPSSAEAVASMGVDGAAAVLSAGWAELNGVDLVPTPPADGATVTDLVASAEATGLPIGPAETLEVLRVRVGLPAMGHELDESTIPAAAGVVDCSVDFTKGCYVGQELVARIDSRGSNTPTRLHAVRAGSVAPGDLGPELLDGDSPVGTITTAVASPALGTIALAYLKRSVEAPRTLQVSTPHGPVPVEVVPLPLQG